MFHKLSTLLFLLVSLSLCSRATVNPVEFDCGNIPQTCSNMCFAVNCKGSPGLLTFDTRDPAVKTARRNAAGCTSPNRCQGRADGRTTCDEYPFASTSQGGANSVTRCVSIAECSSQGGTLSAFYRQFDLTMPNQDRNFGVVVSNFANVLYCNDAAFCTNDGDEFQNGAPARLSLPRNTTAIQKPIGPVYTTESGTLIMSLMGELKPGTKIFKANHSVLAADSSCSDGTDETRKREVVSTDNLGIWEDVYDVVDI